VPGDISVDDRDRGAYAARHLSCGISLMTLAADVDVASARPAPKSPGTKAAIDYLVASGATAITITEHDGVCSFHIGHRIDPHAVSIQWVPEAGARAIVKQARRNAGANPDAATAAKALEDGFLNETCGAPKQLNLRLYLGKVPPRFPA
jgi:hypothetical protein